MIYILMWCSMWLVVVLVALLGVIGGYIVYLLLQKKLIVSDSTTPLTSSQDVFIADLSTIRIKHPVFVTLKAALQEHIVGMDGFINALLIALLVKGHVLVE